MVRAGCGRTSGGEGQANRGSKGSGEDKEIVGEHAELGTLRSLL